MISNRLTIRRAIQRTTNRDQGRSWLYAFSLGEAMHHPFLTVGETKDRAEVMRATILRRPVEHALDVAQAGDRVTAAASVNVEGKYHVLRAARRDAEDRTGV